MTSKHKCCRRRLTRCLRRAEELGQRSLAGAGRKRFRGNCCRRAKIRVGEKSLHRSPDTGDQISNADELTEIHSVTDTQVHVRTAGTHVDYLSCTPSSKTLPKQERGSRKVKYTATLRHLLYAVSIVTGKL